MTAPLAIAVDGGNSKTDLALVRADGEVLAHARGPMSSPHHLGLDGSVEVLEGLLADAEHAAGVSRGEAVLATLLLAGVDFPSEEEQLAGRLEGWAERVRVGNDTFAVLRAGTERGWGVAVTCGAGINCVGVGPDGRQVRFPSLGAISGDWGGGHDVGLAALSAAARSEDGRGPRTSLERSVPAHFGLTKPGEVAAAIHFGRIPARRMLELAPIVFAEAAGDDVAAGIVERLVHEVAALARAAVTRLGLADEPVEVLLGGGLLRSGDGELRGAIEAELRAAAARASVRTAASPPIVGAALLALDELAGTADAKERVRRELGARVGAG